jgi:hypothetical protein
MRSTRASGRRAPRRAAEAAPAARPLVLSCALVALVAVAYHNALPAPFIFDDAGIVGQGATLNGEPMRTAAVSDPSQAVLCTGFPTGRSYSPESLSTFIDSVRRFKKVRLLGSAALCLAFLGAGPTLLRRQGPQLRRVSFHGLIHSEMK